MNTPHISPLEESIRAVLAASAGKVWHAQLDAFIKNPQGDPPERVIVVCVTEHPKNWGYRALVKDCQEYAGYTPEERQEYRERIPPPEVVATEDGCLRRVLSTPESSGEWKFIEAKPSGDVFEITRRTLVPLSEKTKEQTQ